MPIWHMKKAEKKKKPKNQPKTASSSDWQKQAKMSFRDFTRKFLPLPNHFQLTGQKLQKIATTTLLILQL
jgi:hypothetical protein